MLHIMGVIQDKVTIYNLKGHILHNTMHGIIEKKMKLIMWEAEGLQLGKLTLGVQMTCHKQNKTLRWKKKSW